MSADAMAAAPASKPRVHIPKPTTKKKMPSMKVRKPTGSAGSHDGDSGVPLSIEPAPKGSQGAPKCEPGYTICDFIHPRITMGAQYALAHLYVQGGSKCALALSMLGAAEDHEIVGIYKEDEGKPALMAQRNGTYWWNLIGKNQGAIVSELETPPMVVFEKRLANKPSVLAAELEEAWNGSSLAGRSFPPPPPKMHGCAPPPKGNISDEPPTVSEPPKCQCDPQIPVEVMPQCPLTSIGEPGRCLAVPGSSCGVCEGLRTATKKCLETNDKRHKQERQTCKDQHSPGKTAKYAIECSKAIAECAEGKLTSCAEATECIVDPAPDREFRDCLNKEGARWEKEKKRCLALP